MAYRLTLAFALTVVPTTVAAQLSDIGIGVAPSHHQWLDVPSLCCPPLAWATFGEGRWRLRVDYLHRSGLTRWPRRWFPSAATSRRAPGGGGEFRWPASAAGQQTGP